jgi:hypothetical protein
MAINVTPIPKLITLVAPEFSLGTTNSAGSAITGVASNSTLLAFDATLPASTGSPAVGTATVAGRRDHVHGQGASTANLDLASYKLVGNGGSTGIAISAAGEVTMAAQPCFAANRTGNALNVTGAGTAYSPVLFPNQVYDVGGDWAESPGSTFTAPVTGKYVFTSSVRVIGMTTAMTYGVISLVTSKRTWNVYTSAEDSTVTAGWFISAVADMDANDTAYVSLTVYGESGDTVDVAGSSSMSISFSGVLVA